MPRNPISEVVEDATPDTKSSTSTASDKARDKEIEAHIKAEVESKVGPDREDEIDDSSTMQGNRYAESFGSLTATVASIEQEVKTLTRQLALAKARLAEAQVTLETTDGYEDFKAEEEAKAKEAEAEVKKEKEKAKARADALAKAEADAAEDEG